MRPDSDNEICPAGITTSVTYMTGSTVDLKSSQYGVNRSTSQQPSVDNVARTCHGSTHCQSNSGILDGSDVFDSVSVWGAVEVHLLAYTRAPDIQTSHRNNGNNASNNDHTASNSSFNSSDSENAASNVGKAASTDSNSKDIGMSVIQVITIPLTDPFLSYPDLIAYHSFSSSTPSFSCSSCSSTSYLPHSSPPPSLPSSSSSSTCTLNSRNLTGYLAVSSTLSGRVTVYSVYVCPIGTNHTVSVTAQYLLPAQQVRYRTRTHV